jgi:hypothetical protein
VAIISFAKVATMGRIDSDRPAHEPCNEEIEITSGIDARSGEESSLTPSIIIGSGTTQILLTPEITILKRNGRKRNPLRSG